jgi:hypothetical protein
MALLDKYNQGGSTLSSPQPQSSPIGSTTKQSGLHNEFSINGNPNVQFPNPFLKLKPSPSDLDLNGTPPNGALNDPKYGTLNNTFSKGKYSDNLPEGVSF